MADIFALVDCNNFYASCEKIFHPSLDNKPVIVLSNNDGCVIARSEEAKQAGIKMGIPIFEIADVIEKNNVHVFSTNYALYGDISQRVMNTLSSMVPDIEIYSIDEAFLDLSHIPEIELADIGKKIQKRIRKWTGIPVSVGIGPTKILAKAANHISKTNPEYTGVLVLNGNPETDHQLKNLPVEMIWGVGEKYHHFFKNLNICNAFDLLNADENRIREKLGIIGQRLVLELRGTVCYPLNQNPETKKEICTSRSFGYPIENYEELEEATTTYIAKVAKKLRKQKTLAQHLLVFIMTNKYASGPQYVNYKIVKLPSASNQTHELVHYAVVALKELYRKGYKYKKSGVIVSELIPDDGFQTALWDKKNRRKHKKLLDIVDRINENAGIEKVKFAVQGSEETWKMRQHNLSPHYTTRWADILIVDVDNYNRHA